MYFCWHKTDVCECACGGGVPESGSLWGVLTNTQTATEPVSNTHKRSAYTVAAVSLIKSPAVTRSLLRHTNDCAIWRSGAIRYLHCEICEGYLFSQMIKVKWGHSASALEPPPVREKVEAAQLATAYVCSSARWTSCCSASCCRAERHRRLLGTEGEKWSDDAHQSITALLARSPHLPVSRTWRTFSEKKKSTSRVSERGDLTGWMWDHEAVKKTLPGLTLVKWNMLLYIGSIVMTQFWYVSLSSALRLCSL